MVISFLTNLTWQGDVNCVKTLGTLYGINLIYQKICQLDSFRGRIDWFEPPLCLLDSIFKVSGRHWCTSKWRIDGCPFHTIQFLFLLSKLRPTSSSVFIPSYLLYNNFKSTWYVNKLWKRCNLYVGVWQHHLSSQSKLCNSPGFDSRMLLLNGNWGTA